MNNTSNKQYSFAGITSHGTFVLNEDKWECIYTDTYITKQTYEHVETDNENDEDNFSLKYKYLISATDMYDMTGEDDDENMFYVDLHMVPAPESLSLYRLQEVIESCGDDYLAIKDYGYAIRMGAQKVHRDDLDNVLAAAQMAVPLIDSMRGFYLDKQINMIGVDGWDMLKYVKGKTANLW